MAVYWILAMLAGIAGVVQSGLNKRLSLKIGLGTTLHISNLIVLIGGIVILTAMAGLMKNDYSQLLKLKVNFRNLSWWVIVPGLMGLFFIAVAPFVILKLGALKVFVAVVWGQMLGSLAWDRYVEGIAVDRYRLIGCGLTLLGAAAISLSKTEV